MATGSKNFKTTGISRPTKEDLSKTLNVKRRGQNHRMMKMQQHFGKELGVQKSSADGMQNGLTKQKRTCHLINRIQ